MIFRLSCLNVHVFELQIKADVSGGDEDELVIDDSMLDTRKGVGLVEPVESRYLPMHFID